MTPALRRQIDDVGGAWTPTGRSRMTPARRRQCKPDDCDSMTVVGLATQDTVLKNLELHEKELHLRFHELTTDQTESAVESLNETNCEGDELWRDNRLHKETNSEGGAEDLILFLSRHFKTFGVPDSITNDGGQEFASYKVKSFLKKWNIKLKLSSECDPNALTTAKLGIELIKRTLRCYTTKSGFLNCDGFSRAITRYRNTPCGDIGVSPSNVLLGRDLEEQLPVAADVSEVRKQAMAGSLPNLNVGNMAGNFAEFESNLSKGTRSLPDLNYGEMIQVLKQRESNPKWWKRSEKNVERFDFDNYLLMANGGDKRKGGDRRVRNLLEGGDRWRVKNLEGGDNR